MSNRKGAKSAEIYLVPALPEQIKPFASSASLR